MPQCIHFKVTWFQCSSLGTDSLLARCQAIFNWFFRLMARIFPLLLEYRTKFERESKCNREWEWQRARESFVSISVDVYPGPFMLISKLCLNNIMKMVMTFDIHIFTLSLFSMCVCVYICDIWNVDECQFLITDWFRC